MIGVSYLKCSFLLKKKKNYKDSGIEELIKVTAGHEDVHSEYNRGCNGRKGFLRETNLRKKIT